MTTARSRRARGCSLHERISARLMARAEGAMHRRLGDCKATLFAGHPDRLVEIGPGAGANFRYYRPGTRVVAVEPGTAHHPWLEESAARHAVDLEIVEGRAEALPLADASVTFVVATLVLCSVSDPAASIREIRRILEPGGRFAFLEHVAAPPGSALRSVQSLVRRPWRLAFGGCDVTRETGARIEAAGFARVDSRAARLGWRLLPVDPLIVGQATR